MTDGSEDARFFWSTWIFVAFIIVFAMMSLLPGCAPSPPVEIKIVTKEEKDEMLVRDLCLPPGAKNINQIDDCWHTFDLTIDGRTRKFIRRIYGVSPGHQREFSTETFTELTPQ